MKQYLSAITLISLTLTAFSAYKQIINTGSNTIDFRLSLSNGSSSKFITIQPHSSYYLQDKEFYTLIFNNAKYKSPIIKEHKRQRKTLELDSILSQSQLFIETKYDGKILQHNINWNNSEIEIQHMHEKHTYSNSLQDSLLLYFKLVELYLNCDPEEKNSSTMGMIADMNIQISRLLVF